MPFSKCLLFYSTVGQGWLHDNSHFARQFRCFTLQGFSRVPNFKDRNIFLRYFVMKMRQNNGISILYSHFLRKPRTWCKQQFFFSLCSIYLKIVSSHLIFIFVCFFQKRNYAFIFYGKFTVKLKRNTPFTQFVTMIQI